MVFHILKTTDYDKLIPFSQTTYGRLCDYSPACMLMWSENFSVEYYSDERVLIQRVCSLFTGEKYYYLPLGDTEYGIKLILEEEHGSADFGSIPEDFLPFFNIPGYTAESGYSRDYCDYLYKASDLIGLKGKKYAGQRNHIHKFLNAAGSWELKDIDDSNRGDVVDFFSAAFIDRAQEDKFAAAENAAAMDALTHPEKYHMGGSALYADGRIVGFSMSEQIDDTLFIHVEKADRNFPGAYQMLVNTYTAKHALPGIEFVNREEDLGEPGLRAAKLAYHPYALIPKYSVTIKKNTESEE